jgi:hypothetical protein
MILAAPALLFTWKMPPAQMRIRLSTALSSQAKGTLYVRDAAPQPFRRKPEVRLGSAPPASPSLSTLAPVELLDSNESDDEASDERKLAEDR